MNIAFFTRPKQEITYLYSDYTVRQALEKMHSSSYMAVPVLDREGHYLATVSEGNQPVSISSSIEDLIIRSMETNFVPITDDRGIFIGIVTRRSIIKHYYEKNILPHE